MNHLVQTLTLELTCLIMQQKQTSKKFCMLILRSFVLQWNLVSLKTEADKLDIDKLVPVPVDLSKLSDVLKNDVVKKLYLIN